MPDILIRNVPDEIAKSLEEKMRSAGYDNRSEWLVEQLKKIANQPAIKDTYTFRCYGENGAFAQIGRTRHDSTLRIGSRNCSQGQTNAFNKAKEYVQRNGLGDREKALSLLSGAFDEVFEQ